MIRHCVFIRFEPTTSATEKASIYADVAALKTGVPGFLACHIGANVSPEAGMDKGYADGFIVDFDGATSRDAYLVHPGHQAVAGRIVGAAQGGVDGIFVYDIEIVD